MCAAADAADDAFFWEYLGVEAPDPVWKPAVKATPKQAVAAGIGDEAKAQAKRGHSQPPDEPEPGDPQPCLDTSAPKVVASAPPESAASGPTPSGKVPSLTLEQAIELQDLLIEGYKREDFQDRLHEAWAAAKGDSCEELRARQAVCLPIQGPALARFGFEPTRRGVNQSVIAFRPFNHHPEVEDRNLTMQYLVNPPQQNTMWINGFEDPPRWWQRAQRRANIESTAVPAPEQGGADRGFAKGADVGDEPLIVAVEADGPVSEPADISVGEGGRTSAEVSAPAGAPVAFGPCASAAAAQAQEPPKTNATIGETSQRRSAASIDDAINQLSMLQIVLSVPTVERLRSSRPLRRFDDEIYVAQFVLQSTSRNFSKFLNSEEGKVQFHPFLKPSGDAGADGRDGGSFGWLDDRTRAIYQTNGIARTEETIVNTPMKCDRTGAPGHYIETKMLVARRRGRGVAGQYGTGLQAARSFRTRKDVEENLYYSFTSCWQIYACTASVGELGEEDSGERILIRRCIRDFTQHHFHEFPVAKHLAELLDGENRALIDAFAYDPSSEVATSLHQYQCFTLRSWHTYEGSNRPPEDDVGVRLVEAARIGHVSELRRLVLECGCDCNTIISEFGMFGSAGKGYFTRSELGYAEERNALIAAVEAGWMSVVEFIIQLAELGKASLNIVCHEWTPVGVGGAGLRPNYTALDTARIYHRDDIRDALLKAQARFAQNCPRPTRENPFVVRAKQDRGEYMDSGWDRKEAEDRYDGFSFVEWGEEVQMDPEMQSALKGVQVELQAMERLAETDYNKAFKKLCLLWHPDKHPDERKGLATRMFQWLQHAKAEKTSGKAWTA